MLTGKHLISIDDLSNDDINNLFNTAHKLIPIIKRDVYTDVLKGAVLSNLFFEASTRTRMSFAAAFERLGGSVCDTTGFTFSSISKGESLKDTSRVIAGYSDIIVLRHPDEESSKEFSQHINTPVVNGGAGAGEHPTQALLDLYTIKTEFEKKDKTIDHCSVLIFGDLKFGRTVHSLLKLLVRYKHITFTCVSPSALKLPEYLIALIHKHGHTYIEQTNFNGNFTDIDLIYATRIQKERFEKGFELSPLSSDLIINKEMLAAKFNNNVTIMHPLPRDSSDGAIDLSPDLDDYDHLAIFRQTDNGMLIRMALFAMILGVDKDIEKSFKAVKWHSFLHTR